jgi:CRP-like cAMP-binding protein
MRGGQSVAACPRRLRFRRGTLIPLSSDAVLEVRRGVVALTALHADGVEVLLGLCGPEQLVTGHPESLCCLQLVAHTDVEVLIQPWAEAVGQAGFAERLRVRLRQTEAWAAMQARPHLEQRVIGILGLLAESFGTPCPQRGLVIDVRLTHSQLASAVGATRATITRLLNDLRRRGLVTTVRTLDGGRLCLRTFPGDSGKIGARSVRSGTETVAAAV